MNFSRNPVRLRQIGFLALLVVSTAQVLWWMADQATYSQKIRDRQALLYESEAKVITELYKSETTAASVLELLPHLEQKGDTFEVQQTALLVLDRERFSRFNRYMWEGGFFLLVLLGGMTVLTRAIRQEAELRKRQQNFLAAVSHEFKSPLASMRLSAETLLMRAREEDTKRFAQRLLEDGDRLLSMVENLLDITRLEEGQHPFNVEPVKVRSMVEAVVGEIETRARSKGIEIDLDLPARLTLRVDRSAFESVLRNILDNAVKACIAGRGHSVRIRVRETAGHVEMTVRDDGIGFPPQDSALIFEKFYRSGDEIRRVTPGTGVGLYIVRKLVELANGRIMAESEGVGKGATITVQWPVTIKP